MKAGKLDFWRVVSRYPDEAYLYFKERSDAWMVIDTNQLKDVNRHLRRHGPEFRNRWVGPFRLYVPSIGQVIQVFGKADSYESEQERLLQHLKANTRHALRHGGADVD